MSLSSLLALVDRLKEEGFQFALVEGRPRVAPASSLSPGDHASLSNDRKALTLLLTFTDAKRSIIRSHDPGVTLEGLIRYRVALDAWETFTPGERAILLPQEPTHDDLVKLAHLRSACGGEVVGSGESFSTLDRSSRD